MRRRAALLGLACASAFAQQQRVSTAQPNVQVLPERLAMPGLNRERTLRLYLPPSYATQPDRRYPVIYMHDAQNLFDDATSFVGEWGVDETLNALARRSGFEAIVVGIDNGDDKRVQEMLPWPRPPEFMTAEGDAYADFVALAVKPHIDARWRTRPEAEHSAIAGSSLGGLISQHAIARHPRVFGKAAVFSPAFWVAPRIYDEAAQAPFAPGTRVYLYAGTKESDSLVAEVQRMHALLRGRGVAVETHVVEGAQHNEAAWRAEFERALRWLFEIR